MAKYNPGRYMRYQELTELLKNWVQKYPQLMSLESIGQSREGREVWLAVLTDSTSGSHETKPGYWIDANIHALEVAGTQVAMHFIHEILTEQESNERYQDLLKNYVIYVVPRVSPDGSEHVLVDSGLVRSVPEFYPEEELLPGFYREDVNGDGKILSMLIPSRAGMYKKSKKDPRVLLRRLPHENDPNETYYRALPEGRRKGQGEVSKEMRFPQAHDYNRNFPDRWQPEGAQYGAGAFPLSNPETRAMAEYLSQRPNIFGAMSFHTFSGVILRPPIHEDSSKMNPLDLRTYKSLGEVAERATGYPCISIFEDFCYEKSRSISGSFTGWAYECRGLYAFVTEIWHLAKMAGVEIPRGDHIRWLFDETNEDTLIKMLKWCDKNLEKGTYFHDWESFEHPDFGTVEIGGYEVLFTIANPPEKFLEAEVKKNVEMTLQLVESGPLVEVAKKEVKRLNQDGDLPVSVVEIELCNTGFLSTQGAQTAKQARATSAARLKVELSEGLQLIEGDAECEVAPLAGRADTELIRNPLWAGTGFSSDSFKNEKRYSWLIQGSGVMTVHVDMVRGGKKRLTIEL